MFFSPRNAIEIAAWDAASSPRTLEKLASWYWRGTSEPRRFRDGFITTHQVLQACIATRRHSRFLLRTHYVRAMVRLTIRVDFEPGHALGPGKIHLLEQLEATGSIRGAASAMKMSYRRAWLLIQAMEKTFGVPLVAAATGGRRGGGATLTTFGKRVVRLYRRIEQKAGSATASPAKALAHSRYSKPRKSRKSAKNKQS